MEAPCILIKLKKSFIENNDLFKLNMKYFNHGKANFDYSYKSKTPYQIYSDKLRELFDFEINNLDKEIFRKNLLLCAKYMNIISENIRQS